MPISNVEPPAASGGRSFARPYVNPFAPPSASASSRHQPTTCISEPQFAEQYAAAEFAYHWGTYLDTSVTITWPLLGVTEEDQMLVAFANFTACLRAWMTERPLPTAWTYVHERSRIRGLHTHLAVFVPGAVQLRRRFRTWVLGWAERFAGHKAPYATRVRDAGGRTDQTLHWLNFAYQMKGFDREAVVQSARNAPHGQDVMLGDLVGFDWRDPGVLTCKRTGVSQALGPAQRKLGFPPWAAFLMRPTDVPDIQVSRPPGAPPVTIQKPDYVGHMMPKPFRSSYEDGMRDIRQLYPADFIDVVRLGFGVLTQRAAEERAEALRAKREAEREAEALRRAEEGPASLGDFGLFDD